MRVPRTRRTIALLIVGIAAFVTIKRQTRSMYTAPLAPEPSSAAASRTRQDLFVELQPVRLAKCELARFGEPNDGGYLLCGNLLAGASAAYSYGISGYDGWGCDISRKLRIAAHQYDCFDSTRPSCQGDTSFHEECIAFAPHADERGRRFETLEHQLTANGHDAARVVVKMDVEGAEWDVLLAAPDAVLDSIDQLVVEFHGTAEPKYVETVRRLKRFFLVAHLHFNNYSCWDALEPFPAWAYEVSFVNKRLDTEAGGAPPVPHRLDAANNLRAPDCQRAGAQLK